MTDPNKINNPGHEGPNLGDILQLQATIEALPEEGLRDLSEGERIAVNRSPEGHSHSEGTQISHISLSQRVANTDNYRTVMNYIVLRDGDETTTRLIKRPPFAIPSLQKTFQGYRPESFEGKLAAREALDEATNDLDLYEMAGRAGLYELTADEVHGLTQSIAQAFSPKK